MKRLFLSLSVVLFCYSIAHANLPAPCENIDDHGGSCAASDDCVGRCAGPWGQRLGMNPLLPGFFTGHSDGQMVVTGVIPYSPASAAGVMVGDRLISVDQVRLPASFGLKALWQQQKEHDVTVERAGRILHFAITPEPEQEILAKAWSEFDPVGQGSLELVGFKKHHPTHTPLVTRKAFVSGIRSIVVHGRVEVTNVLPGSAAQALGIRKGDIITQSSSRDIESSDSRSQVDLNLQRGKRTISLRLRMTSVSEVLAAMAAERQSKLTVVSGMGL